MQEIMINEKDLFVMNLVHYFITERNYNPIIVQGISDEIWLENLDSDCKVIRIVSHHIHNDEQLGFDKFKLNKIIKGLKIKTLSFKLDVLNIYTDLGDSVKIEEKDIFIPNQKGIANNALIEKFPDIVEKTKHKEKGISLFMKITEGINDSTIKKNNKLARTFSIKYPLVTYLLIGINILIYLFMLFGNGNQVIADYGLYKPLVLNGEYYRIITCMFIHGNIFHLLCNMYSLYVIGPQIESFFGKKKFVFIYFISGICGSLLSMTFGNYLSIGASGAIFGLLGSMIYFGMSYRAYLGNVVRSQIIPLVILNLGLGFILSNIDNFGHIGGLIGGVLSSMIVGVPDKPSKIDRVNGIIILIIYVVFLCFLTFR